MNLTGKISRKKTAGFWFSSQKNEELSFDHNQECFEPRCKDMIFLKLNTMIKGQSRGFIDNTVVAMNSFSWMFSNET